MGIEYLDLPLVYLFFLAGAMWIICHDNWGGGDDDE